MTSPRAVVIVAFEGVQALDVTGPHEVFAGAAEGVPGSDAVQVVSVSGGAVTSESGLAIVPGRLDAVGEIDTVVVAGGRGVRKAAADSELVAGVAARTRRVVSVCSGAFLLAAGRSTTEGPHHP